MLLLINGFYNCNNRFTLKTLPYKSLTLLLHHATATAIKKFKQPGLILETLQIPIL